jgi:UDP-N-acetylmuramate--alanine ligase
MKPLPKKLYFLGLGGMGMAPLALFLAGRGYEIEGNDDHFRVDVLDILNKSPVVICNQPSDDVGMIVVSSAIKEQHPLVRWARERSVPILNRGIVLAHATANDRLIAVVGSHGKTSTTAVLIHLLLSAGADFDYVLGGLFAGGEIMPAKGRPDTDSQSRWVVAEVDESDGTIDHFSPEITLAVDWDWDHPDRYSSAQKFESTLFSLFRRTKGEVHIPEDKRAAVDEVVAKFCNWTEESVVLPAHFPLLGRCNRRNAAAAYSVTRSVMGSWDNSWWNGFPGVIRRQQHLGSTRYWNVFQDYAHHPAELKGLFDAIDTCRKDSEKAPLVIFQPHRFSRTKQFADAFARELLRWEDVGLLPVYSAGEDRSNGAGTDLLQACFPENCRPPILQDEQALSAFLAERTEADGSRAVWFVGAGDIESHAWRWMRATQSKERWITSSPEDLWSGCVSVVQGEPLGNKTTLRVGGTARYYAEPEDRQQLLQLWERAHQHGIRVYPMGRGSNLLIMDEGVDGLVLRLRRGEWEEIHVLEDGGIRVGAGVPLKLLCGKTSAMGLKGFEFLEGIPGSVGGALRMNAGAMGGWMMDVVREVEILTREGIRTFTRDELHAQYRYCREVAQGVALSAVIYPTGKEDADLVKGKIREFSERRKESQPRESSAGCIFKNPDGNHAGKLVDQAGLKGLRVGDAEVSLIHGNFIINHGNASSEEIMSLIRMVRKQLYRKNGYILEPEVLLWGAEWKDVL